MTARARSSSAVAAIVLTIAIAASCTHIPSMAAGALLQPSRHRVTRAAPPGCEEASFRGVEITLRGWRCGALTRRAGTLVFLHGIADNRSSAAGLVQRFTTRGLDVIAYDSRAHGDSEGDACTYGFYEKDDLRAVLDTMAPGPVVVIGTSLGAAVALQAAAVDRRITTVVAAEVFSDLRSVARERAPFFLTEGTIRTALALAEKRGRFEVDAVSPVAAAARVTIPVLLIHGADDTDTRPAHSQRVHDALRGPKRLILVEGAGHNQSLSSGAVWREIERWIETILTDARS
jgi:pimeloyl-ACP methyl ester carboxylesterase